MCIIFRSYIDHIFHKDIDFLDYMRSPPRELCNTYRQLQLPAKLPAKLLQTNSESSLLLVTRQENARTVKRATAFVRESCKSRVGSSGVSPRKRKRHHDESINSLSIRRVTQLVFSTRKCQGFRNLEVHAVRVAQTSTDTEEKKNANFQGI